MTLSLTTRPATSGSAEEIISSCPICGKKGWCYVLPAQNKQSLTKIICKRNPYEVPDGFEALTYKNGSPVQTSDGEYYRVFAKEVELLQQQANGEKKPWVQPEKKEKIHDTTTWLSTKETDRQYRLLANNRPLDPHHLGDLARRGFTEDEIKKYGFFSIHKWMKAPRGVSRYFPGFAQGKNDIGVQAVNNLPKDGGYSVPYFNHERQIVGYQIRTSDAERKYIWARGENPSKLKVNAEDPISVLHDMTNKHPHILWAMEGGLKGIGVHERLGLNTLSASGGYFNKGESQIRDAIAAFGITDIIICPDAGDIINSHVRLRWTRQAEWFQAIFPELDIHFAWWGQIDKEAHKDIDEMSRPEMRRISYLTVEKWKESIRENARSFKDLMTQAFEELKSDVPEKTSGFGYGYTPQEAAPDDALHWEPGMIIPNGYRDGKSNPTRTIVFKREHRRELLLALERNGARLILETSVMGSGKSLFTGKFQVEGTPWKKAFYISSTHNEPSNPEIAERFTNIAPRHSGAVQTGRHTYRYNPPDKMLQKAKPEHIIVGNCQRSEQFKIFYGNGYGSDSLEQSPCGTCNHLPYCRAAEGDGYGYFHQKIKALSPETQYVRCDIRQLPKNANFDKAIAFVDESDKQLMPTRSTVVDYEKIIGQLAAIETSDPILSKELEFVKRFVNAAFIHTKSEDQYGLPHEVLQRLLEGVPEKVVLRRIISRTVDILTPHFREILDLPDRLVVDVDLDKVGLSEIVKEHDFSQVDWLKYMTSSWYRTEVEACLPEEKKKVLHNWWVKTGNRFSKELRKERDRARAANNYFLDEVAESNLAKLNALPGLGVTHLLEYIYTGKGALRIEGQSYEDRKLYITLPNHRHIESLKSFDMVVLFDATMDIRSTKELFKLKEIQIYHIQEELPSYDNLEVISVNVAGVGSAEISEVAKKRLEAAVDEIKKRENNENVAVIGRKGDGDDFYWFNHNRGSNEFYNKGVKTLIAKGTPWVHVGAMRDECRAIYGDYLATIEDEAERKLAFENLFSKFYQHKVGAEIQQATGRLRHQWRSDEKLKFYLLTTRLDINFLNKRFGVKVRHMEGFELTPHAGTKSEMLLFKIMGIAHVLFDQSGKTRLPRQKEIADLLNIKQGRVSQIAEQYFTRGWKEFRRILLSSLYTADREVNNLSWQNDETGNDQLAEIGWNSGSGVISAFLTQNQSDLAKPWTPEPLDDVLHHCCMTDLVGDPETASENSLIAWTQWLETLHPYDQGQAIAHLLLLSESGSEMRGSGYEGLSGLFRDIGHIQMKNGWYTRWEGLEEYMPSLFTAE